MESFGITLHWNGSFVVVTKFSPLAVQKVVISTTFGVKPLLLTEFTLDWGLDK